MNTDMDVILNVYRDWLVVSGFSTATIRHRLKVIRLLPNVGIDPLNTSSLELLSWLATYTNQETKHSYRSALRTFYTWATDYDVLSDDPSAKLPKVKVSRGTPHPISDDGLRQLIEITRGQTRAVVLVMAYCGLRGSEACGLKPADFERDGAGWRVRIRQPKGGGEQVVPVPMWVADEVREFFPTDVQHGQMVKRISAALRLVEPGATPHSLRHWYATTALRRSGNVRIVQELMRHKSLASTQIYTQVSSTDTSAVAEMLPSLMDLPRVA